MTAEDCIPFLRKKAMSGKNSQADSDRKETEKQATEILLGDNLGTPIAIVMSSSSRISSQEDFEFEDPQVPCLFTKHNKMVIKGKDGHYRLSLSKALSPAFPWMVEAYNLDFQNKGLGTSTFVLDKFLMPDILEDTNGHTWKNNSIEEAKLEDPDDPDDTLSYSNKTFQIFCQMHILAAKHPEKNFPFIFSDDSYSAINVNIFFSRYSYLIPIGVTLKCIKYKSTIGEREFDLRGETKGSGMRIKSMDLCKKAIREVLKNHDEIFKTPNKQKIEKIFAQYRKEEVIQSTTNTG